MADKRIKDLTNTAAESDIASGNYFALDGSAGTKKLNSTTLLTKTAQNALAGNVAPAFVPNETNAVAGMPYVYGGQLYVAKENYNGDWDTSKFVSGSISSLSQLAQSKEFSIVGANLTVQNVYIPLCRGINKIKVKATPNPWPTDTIGGSNPGILIIYGVAADGAETAKKQYNINSTIPEEILIDVSETDLLLHFFIRANYQSVVRFQVVNNIVGSLEELESAVVTEEQRITDANSAISDLNAGVFGSPEEFAGSGTTAIPSKEYKAVGLSCFVVDFSENASWPTSQLIDGSNKFWLQTNAGGTWSDLTVAPKSSTRMKFVVDVPVNATKVRFFVRCNTGTTLKCSVSSAADATTFSLTGRGTTAVNKYIRVKPSTEYHLIADKSWNTAGISSTSGVMSIYASNENLEEVTRLVNTQVPQVPTTEYRFVTPDDCSIVKILFRAASGVSVSFNLSENYPTIMPAEKVYDLGSLRHFNGYSLPGILLMGDPHSSSEAYADYLKLLNQRDNPIEAVLVLGDMARDNPGQEGTYDNFKAFVNGSSKPVLPVIGNHDIGSGWCLNQYASVGVAVENIMSDAVSRGFIPSAPKGYYYIDVGSAWNYKARVIVLNNYNIPGVYDSDSLWEQVAYDSSAPQIALNTNYSQGDVVNVGLWTDYSYRATESLTTPSTQPTSKVHNFPCWSVRPDAAKIDAEQAQWLLDTMATTPNYTGIVIVQHSTLSTDCTKDLSSKFTQKNGPALEVSGVGDFLVEAAKAFEEKNSAFTYSVQGATVSKDFSERTTTSSFVGFVGGHQHHDYIVRSSTYPKYYEVIANKAMLSYAGDNSDIFTKASAPSATFVAINRETKAMGLSKIGIQYTQDGYARDLDIVKQEAPAN